MKKRKILSTFYLFLEMFFSVMKWIRHAVVSTQWFLRPCILFSLRNKTLQRGPAVFKNVSGAFLVHMTLQPVICSRQICAFASLASPLPTTCSLLSAQTASYFSISCISDNQTSLVLYFFKALYATLTQYIRSIACNLMLVYAIFSFLWTFNVFLLPLHL